MKTDSYRLVFAAQLLLLILSGCGSSETDDSFEVVQCNGRSTTPYTLDLPDHLPQFVTPSNNLTTNEGVALGRRLYYDETLSLGGPLEGSSCASCHIQTSSFSNNSQGTAVLLHTNLNWSSHYLWNGKISGSLEDVMEFEIADFFQADISRFKADSVYQQMNCDAFGSSDLTLTDMANAMAQWMRTLVSSDSKYDRYLAGKEELTEQESRGEFLFNSDFVGCFVCHPTPLTTDLLFRNNGLESFVTGENQGRFNVTQDPEDMGKFKTPTLRNIAVTAPYMHDGRFQSLEEVVQFYNTGIKRPDTLDPALDAKFVGAVYDLGLTEENIAELVAFLNTFTDESFLNNSKFSDPFK